MKLFLILSGCLFLFGCGAPSLSPFEITSLHEPHVVMVEPENGSKTSASAVVIVEFSERMDPISINRQNLAIVKIDSDSKTVADLSESVVDGDTEGINGVYEVQGEGRVAVFRSERPYENGASYVVVATNKVTSLEKYPLNQRPGRSPGPFVSTFTIEGGEEEAGERASDENPAPEDSSGGDETGEVVGDTLAIPRPASVIINEILYDIVGDDTNGDVFVELLGDTETDVSGYKLVFVNGDDGRIYDTIELPQNSLTGADGIFLIADSKIGESGISSVAGADLIVNFDPQNGPDCVQLLNETGSLLDVLGYGTPISAAAENGLACFEGAPMARSSSGRSLSRMDGMDTGDNSVDFSVMAAPTPGVR